MFCMYCCEFCESQLSNESSPKGMRQCVVSGEGHSFGTSWGLQVHPIDGASHRRVEEKTLWPASLEIGGSGDLAVDCEKGSATSAVDSALVAEPGPAGSVTCSGDTLDRKLVIQGCPMALLALKVELLKQWHFRMGIRHLTCRGIWFPGSSLVWLISMSTLRSWNFWPVFGRKNTLHFWLLVQPWCVRAVRSKGSWEFLLAS